MNTESYLRKEYYFDLKQAFLNLYESEKSLPRLTITLNTCSNTISYNKLITCNDKSDLSRLDQILPSNIGPY